MAAITALAAVALICAIPLVLADLIGMMLGLGWGHYSKKLKAKWRDAGRTSND